MSDNEAPIIELFLIFMIVIVIALMLIGTANRPETKNKLPPILFYFTLVPDNETYSANITEPYYMIFDYPEKSNLCPENTSYQSKTCYCAINTSQPCMMECFECVEDKEDKE